MSCCWVCVWFYTHRYLIQNLDWLEEQIGNGDDDYYLFDCPGTCMYSISQLAGAHVSLFCNFKLEYVLSV